MSAKPSTTMARIKKGISRGLRAKAAHSVREPDARLAPGTPLRRAGGAEGNRTPDLCSAINVLTGQEWRFSGLFDNSTAQIRQIQPPTRAPFWTLLGRA